MVHGLSPGEATQIIVACGAGSVYEAVIGILASGSDTSPGIVTVDIGNNFAKLIATPLDWRRALA